MIQRNFHSQQRGLTLVEILVALTLGLVLIAGLLQLFVGTRQAFRTQENLSRVQENGRYAVDYLSRYLRLAGYRSRTTVFNKDDFYAASDDSRLQVPPITGTDNSGPSYGTGAVASDSVTIRFEGEIAGGANGIVRNCFGDQIDYPTVSAFTLDLSNSNELQCTTLDGTPATEPIIENVANMQILYGENTNLDIKGIPDRYVTAANVTDWYRVTSIRVELTLITPEDNVSVTDDAVFGRRLNRVFTTTITLRNRSV